MAILHKGWDSQGYTPSSSDLEPRQLGINLADGKLFLKRGDGVVLCIGADISQFPTLTQLGQELSALMTLLDDKADSQHTHAIAQIDGLQNALDGKASTSHTHQMVDVAGIADALMQKADHNHTHNFAVAWESPGAIGAITPNSAKFTQLTVQSGVNIGIQTAVDGGVRFPYRVGFYDKTPIGKSSVTQSRGGNAALASLLTALHNLGLITNNTTA